MYQRKVTHAFGYYVAIVASLLLVWVLCTWRLPWVGLVIWPAWPLLWLCFWMTYAQDDKMQSFWVWIAGFGMDGLTGSLLGFHVFLYLLVYYGLMARHWKIYLFSVLSRPLFVLLMMILASFIEQITINGWQGSYYGLVALGQGLSTFVLWFMLSGWFDTRLARSQYLSSFEIK